MECASDEDCHLPTPSCHPNMHSCVCRRPHSGNLLKNPGFDSSLSDWTLLSGSTVSLAEDAEGCTASHSGFVYNSGDSLDPRQCFTITGGTSYYFGGWFKLEGFSSWVTVRFYPADNCAGDYDSMWQHTVTPNSSWNLQREVMPVPAGTRSATIGMLGMQLSFDQLYVNATTNHF